jgi:hypothetical protein
MICGPEFSLVARVKRIGKSYDLAADLVEDMGNHEKSPPSAAGIPASLPDLRVGELEGAWLVLVCLDLKHERGGREFYSEIVAKAVVTRVAAEDVATIR